MPNLPKIALAPNELLFDGWVKQVGGVSNDGEDGYCALGWLAVRLKIVKPNEYLPMTLWHPIANHPQVIPIVEVIRIWLPFNFMFNVEYLYQANDWAGSGDKRFKYTPDTFRMLERFARYGGAVDTSVL